MTHLTQDFKDKCQKVINDWNKLVQVNSGELWKVKGDIIDKGKNEIFNSSFFINCNNWNGEQQIYFYSLLCSAFTDGNTGTIRNAINTAGATGNDGTGRSLLGMVDILFYWFWRSDGGKKWGDAETLSQQINASNTAKTNAEKARDTAQTSLKSWTDTFGNKTPTELKAELDKLKTDLSDREHTIKDLNKQLSERPTDEKVKDLNKQLADKDLELGKRTESINTLTTERDTLKTDFETKFLKKYKAGFDISGFSMLEVYLDMFMDTGGDGSKITTKLIDYVKDEIKTKTGLFYSELSLDKSDDIDPMYQGDYLTKLNDLGYKSEPSRVINAFKIVALIAKTEKLQKEYDELKNENIAPNIKTNKSFKCKEVKKKWGLITLTPTEKHNPLWLPIIKDSNIYWSKLDKLIELWQA